MRRVKCDHGAAIACECSPTSRPLGSIADRHLVVTRMQTPSTHKAAEYRQRARDARERAVWLSVSEAREQLLDRAVQLDLLAAFEEQRERQAAWGLSSRSRGVRRPVAFHNPYMARGIAPSGSLRKSSRAPRTSRQSRAS